MCSPIDPGSDPDEHGADVDAAPVADGPRACESPGWELDGLCAGSARNFCNPDPTVIEACRLICRQCPVRAVCFDDALSCPSVPIGVRGGFSAVEIAKMRRSRAQ